MSTVRQAETSTVYNHNACSQCTTKLKNMGRTTYKPTVHCTPLDQDTKQDFESSELGQIKYAKKSGIAAAVICLFLGFFASFKQDWETLLHI